MAPRIWGRCGLIGARVKKNSSLVAAIKSVALAAGADAETIARLTAAAQEEPSTTAESYLRTREAAAALDCHPKSVFRYARRGLLHAVKRSARSVRWRKSEVDRLVAGGAA